MGGIAIISRGVTTAGDSMNLLPMDSPVGVGPGGLYVAVALVFSLAYLHILKAGDVKDPISNQLRAMLISVSFPLLITFLGIVLFEGLKAL